MPQRSLKRRSLKRRSLLRSKMAETAETVFRRAAIAWQVASPGWAAITALVMAGMAGPPAGAGEAAIALHQFDEQIELLRQLPPIRVEYLETDNDIDRLRSIMFIRGSSYRFA